MFLTKNDVYKIRSNKKYNENNKNLIKENKKINNKNENIYFHKKSQKNDNTNPITEILNQKNFPRYYNKNKNKKNNFSNLNENIYYNTNSVKNRNKIINNDNIFGMITDFNFYNKRNINIENKRKQKNSSMDQRIQKINDEIFLNEDNEEEKNKRNYIYLRLDDNNSPVSQVKKNFGNQFNIGDAKNILNINYFYDQIENNFENQDNIFYTDNFKKRYLKNIKSTDRRNKYNSLILTQQRNEYTIPTKTINSFYIRKNPVNLVKNINSNNINDDEFSNNEHFNIQKNIEDEKKNIQFGNNGIRKHSSFEKNDNNYSIDKYYSNTVNNNNNKIIRRNGNKIKIFKKNNHTSIQEYNLSLENEDDSLEDLESSDNDSKYNFQNNGNTKNFSRNKINNNKDLNEIRQYQKYFIKNIRPICVTQFEIKNTKSNIKKKNFININKAKTNYYCKRNILLNKNANNKIIDKTKNLEGTPNFKEIGKTPKNNNILLKEKINSLSLTEHLESKFRQKILDINSNSLHICKNNDFEFISKKTNDNRLIFETEEEMIEYIYNKFEEERKKKNYFNKKLRFTGFVLTKKYKGKNLSDIRIEENIDQINKKLNDENILINGKKIELIFTDELNNLKLYKEENRKLKEEKENIDKKDNIKNELIQKLNEENMKLSEELNKLKKEIEQRKEIQK